jgi:hypothetical protein
VNHFANLLDGESAKRFRQLVAGLEKEITVRQSHGSAMTPPYQFKRTFRMGFVRYILY